MSISNDDLGRITQQTSVIASDGDKLGKINQVYTSDATGEPAWVTLETGLFGSQESFVPLADASFEGDDIRVPVTKQAVHDAPRVDADGHLSVEEEDGLYQHYGLHNPGQPDGDAVSGTQHDDRSDTDRAAADRTDPVDADQTDADSHGTEGEPVALAGAGVAGAASTVPGSDRDDELAQRDVDGRDEVADRSDEVAPGRARGDDRPVRAEDGPELADTDRSSGAVDADEVKPGERTTQLRRYVVTERVVRTVEELPDEPTR